MVGFRYYAVRNANRLGVSGYVKNLASGDVEVVASADQESLNEFIDVLKKGPPAARITDIKIDKEPEIKQEFKEFRIKY